LGVSVSSLWFWVLGLQALGYTQHPAAANCRRRKGPAALRQGGRLGARRSRWTRSTATRVERCRWGGRSGPAWRTARRRAAACGPPTCVQPRVLPPKRAPAVVVVVAAVHRTPLPLPLPTLTLWTLALAHLQERRRQRRRRLCPWGAAVQRSRTHDVLPSLRARPPPTHADGAAGGGGRLRRLQRFWQRTAAAKSTTTAAT